VHPAILLTGWTLLSVGLVVSAVAAISLVALPADRHEASGLMRLAGGCWTALSSGKAPGWHQTIAGGSILLSGTLLGRLGWALSERLRHRRRTSPQLAQLRQLAAETGTTNPLWINDRRPLAMSVSGRPSLIIMTQELRERLSPEALLATLEHERAHLRGRHHALLAITETLAVAYPFCPMLRIAPHATKDLVELAADAQAARRCGPAAVREALSQLTGDPVVFGGLGMADHLIKTRLHRLHTGHVAAAGPARWVGYLTAASSALLLPAATGWLALNIIACVVT
jgi:hypothetical protein